MKKIVLILATGLSLAASAGADTAWQTMSDDGAWCWFSDPRALARDGKTYAGWMTADGSVQIGAFDSKTGAKQVATLHAKYQADDHDNPSLIFMPDGRLMAFYCKHGPDDMRLRVTEKPGDISSWTPERGLGFMPGRQQGSGITYQNHAFLSDENNALYLFWRGTNWKPNFAVSKDLGATWSAPRTLFMRRGAGSYNRPYMKVWNDGKGRIDFLFTDGHPRNEPSNSVHFARYEKGAFWKADGTKIGTMDDLPIDPAKCDLIYDGATAGRGWIWDLCEDKDGRPVVLYTRLPAETDHRYWYARWDGAKWDSHEICAGGKWFPHTEPGKKESEPHYSGGMSLDPADPGTVYASMPVNGRFEIWRWTTRDGGAVWTGMALTSNSTEDNVRPFVVRNHEDKTGGPTVLWMSLDRYVHFTDYRTKILMDRRAPAPELMKADFAPAAILKTMELVGDWQLAHPATYKATDWTQGALYTGMMALDGVSPSPRFREAMRAMGEANGWKPGSMVYHADDHCVGQTYCELYAQYREPKMLAGLRERFDFILANPATNSLKFGIRDCTKRWSWCDSLFMAPPAWIRLWAATGDAKYRDFAIDQWWKTSDYLYDAQEHLYFRDSTYFEKREANGKKVFWSRGNGWVMGGLVRMLEVLPSGDPARSKFEQQFKEMAAAVLKCQQDDGLWRSSLLDPASYPLKETSGSGFYTYALAWGINQGLLDRATYEPAVRKGWAGLVGCVQSDGKLTHVQPIGADPKKFDQNHSDVYGVGAFLLAGSELYRMALLDASKHATVNVASDLDLARSQETVELDWRAVTSTLGTATPEQIAVMDGATSRILDSQVIDENGEGMLKLLFQSDFLPKQEKTFILIVGLAAAQRPAPALTTFGRFVPERKDDFAWENDRIAFRMYGPALQHTPGETWGSGVDVWVKSVRHPVIDTWYKTDKYHENHGEGLDCYKVGLSRGCGGLGIVVGDKFVNSADFTTWKVLANGPIRTTFELTYAPWKAGGRTVSEVKRVSLDRGSNLNRFECTLSSDTKEAIPVAAGIVMRDGTSAVSNVSPDVVAVTEPEAKPNGSTHCAMIVPGSGQSVHFDGHTALACSAVFGKPVVYYAGAGWTKGLDFPDAASWQNYVREFAARLKSPLHVVDR